MTIVLQSVLRVRMTCAWVCVATPATVGSGCVAIAATIWDVMVMTSAVGKSLCKQSAFSPLELRVNLNTPVN